MNSAPNLLAPVLADDAFLRLAVAAYLARYKGDSRTHTASDLRTFLDWCTRHQLAPLSAQRPHIELYLRWMQEVQTVQAVNSLPTTLGGHRFLPDLRY